MNLHYLIGIDPGQKADPTALALIEWPQMKDPPYRVRGLHCFPLGTPYTELPHFLKAKLAADPLSGHVALAIDATGVGAPVIDHFRQEIPNVPLFAITITGGASVTGTSKSPHVPKRDLIATTSVLLEQQRIGIAASMRETETLRDELLAYRRSTTEAGSDTYAAASGSHDDLVLALSLALWTAENKRLAPPQPYRSQMKYLNRTRLPTTDEMLAQQHSRYWNFPYGF